uniref:Transcriptional regulator, LuxR family n=1 Tax=Caulobacter sp. (strain K31) TaxID=366602 RepID=B0T701_CAUSK
MTDGAFDALPETPSLTAREIECIRLAALGLTTGETAQRIQVAERTVEFHLGNAMRKLGATNKLRAVVIAMQRKLIDP